jgi:hypothetical protein
MNRDPTKTINKMNLSSPLLYSLSQYNNMKTFLLTALLVCAGTTFSQTKLIFHKSHSGSSSSFMKSINGNYSNFGRAPIREVKNAMLDSVIFLNDTSAVMVTSEYCTRKGEYSPAEMEGTTKTRNQGELWRAGRDTVYNHPLFSRKHSLDSIKMVVATEYYFKNNIDNVRFLGYDNEAVPETQKVVKQPAQKNGNEVYLLLVFVIALLLFSMAPAARSSKAVR